MYLLLTFCPEKCPFPKKKQFLRSVLLSEQRKKERQIKLNAQITIPCSNISVICLEIDSLFFALFEDFLIGLSDSSLDFSTNSEQKCIKIEVWVSTTRDKSKFDNCSCGYCFMAP